MEANDEMYVRCLIPRISEEILPICFAILSLHTIHRSDRMTQGGARGRKKKGKTWRGWTKEKEPVLTSAGNSISLGILGGSSIRLDSVRK